MSIDHHDDYDVDPEEVCDRLEKPFPIRGYSRELYREANLHFQEFLNFMVNEKEDEAFQELEFAERLLTRAEIDVERRDGAHHVYEYYPDKNLEE